MERTNDRDYEIEERYVRCCLAAFIFEQKRLGILMGWQTVPNHGGSIDSLTKRSKGVFGFVTRCVAFGFPGWGYVVGRMLTSIAMTASQMRIAETIDAFYGDAGTRDGVSRSYKQAVEDLDAETIKALDGPYRYYCSPSLCHYVV